MARLAGVDLPRDKRMEIALTYIFGIGRTRSKEILEATGIDRDLRSKDLSDEDLAKLREFIENNYRVEGDLTEEQADRYDELAELAEAVVAVLRDLG